MSHPSSKYRPDAFSGILISQTGSFVGSDSVLLSVEESTWCSPNMTLNSDSAPLWVMDGDRIWQHVTK